MHRFEWATAASDTLAPILFPQGEYLPITYDIGTAYLSAGSADPQACYRFINAIAEQPELLLGLPASSRVASKPEMASVWNENIVTFYSTLLNAAALPKSVVFPSVTGSRGYFQFVASYWLFKAVDDYIAGTTDLGVALATAEASTQAFIDCVGGSPIETRMAADAYPAHLISCAVAIDPSIQSFLYFESGSD